ncbi:MAG: TIR domain-containing protein [Chloroflexota bacterium]
MAQKALLDKPTFDRVVQIITPRVLTTDMQATLIGAAFTTKAPNLIAQFNYGTGPGVFAVAAVTRCLDYGRVNESEHALSVLLGEIQGKVGSEQAEEIQKIRNTLDGVDAPVVEEKNLPPANVPEERKHVFVSYASVDRYSFIERFRNDLQAAGFTLWVDNLGPDSGGIPTGENWQQALANAVEQAAAVVLIVTPESVRSAWVHAEVRRALEKGKPVLPLIVRELREADDRKAYKQLGFDKEQYTSFTKNANHDLTMKQVIASLDHHNVPRNS